MSQWDYKIDQPMPGPFPFPNLRKGPGIEVDESILIEHVLPPIYNNCKLHMLLRFTIIINCRTKDCTTTIRHRCDLCKSFSLTGTVSTSPNLAKARARRASKTQFRS